jgi:L-lactate dehydrogenase complex protein LldG
MAELHKIVAALKDALEVGQEPDAARAAAHAPVPVAPSAERAELAARFHRELEAVAGRFLGIVTPAELAARIVEAAQERRARTVAVGAGVVNDADAIASALASAGMTVVRPGAVGNAEMRAAMRDRLARCDLGIAEAHYAIASTGTLAIVSAERRPGAVTLLPPATLVLVQIDRLVPDVAAVLASLGSETIAAHRVTLITGPSRTADIEKMIVLGVHGPKSLDVALVWPRET